MTQDVFNFLSGFFSAIWGIFNSWYIPGTNVTPAGLLLFLVFVPITLRFILNVIGVGSIQANDVKSVKNKMK